MESSNDWNLRTRIAFRFAFVYIAVYLLTAAPVFTGPLRFVLRALVAPLYNAFAAEPIVVSSAGGSLGNDFSMAAAALLLAIVITPVWCALERTGKHDAWLHLWLRWAVRYFVLGTMVIYGVAKVIQFGPPALSQLLEPIGSLTPMGVLWLFMGTSKAYSLFAGFCEVAGGLLLITRRTTTLGALVCAAVMTNVWLMNVLYEVPVKTLSLHLLLLSIFLVLPDLRRIVDVFVFNRATEPAPEPPLFRNPMFHRIGVALRVLIVIGSLGFAVALTVMVQRSQVRSPLQGAWWVVIFEKDEAVQQPLLTDSQRWMRIIVDHLQVFAIQRADGTVERYSMRMEGDSKIILTRPGAPQWRAELSFRQEQVMNATPHVFEGQFDGSNVKAVVNKEELTRFPLLQRARQ